MNFPMLALLALSVTVAACDSRRRAAEPAKEADAPAKPLPTDQERATPAAPGTPGGLPDDRAPLAEPKGTIDPKSAEAAGQVVQKFAALIEQQRYAEAAKLWSGPQGRKAFDRAFGDASEVHMQIGKPGRPEGAAGSIYVEVSIVLYGNRSGKPFSSAGTAVLRRINDVPGSSEDQRRWHIERIDLH